MSKAIDCGDPTSNLSTIFQDIKTGSPPSVKSFGGTMMVQCITGYKFIDGAEFKLSNCTAVGKWELSEICNGIFIFLLNDTL